MESDFCSTLYKTLINNRNRLIMIPLRRCEIYIYIYKYIYMCVCVCVCVCATINLESVMAPQKFVQFHHHQHVAPSARIPLTFSNHPSQSSVASGRSSVTSRISTELLYVGSSWSCCLCSSIWRGPQEYITYELVPTSPAVSRMSGSSNFDSFRDGL